MGGEVIDFGYTNLIDSTFRDFVIILKAMLFLVPAMSTLPLGHERLTFGVLSKLTGLGRFNA